MRANLLSHCVWIGVTHTGCFMRLDSRVARLLGVPDHHHLRSSCIYNIQDIKYIKTE